MTLSLYMSAEFDPRGKALLNIDALGSASRKSPDRHIFGDQSARSSMELHGSRYTVWTGVEETNDVLPQNREVIIFEYQTPQNGGETYVKQVVHKTRDQHLSLTKYDSRGNVESFKGDHMPWFVKSIEPLSQTDEHIILSLTQRAIHELQTQEGDISPAQSMHSTPDTVTSPDEPHSLPIAS